MEIKTKKKSKSKTKKKTAKSISKIVKDAPAEHYFILANGQPIKNVKELADALEHLADDVFNHHVTHDKNDFANWIQHIFEDTELAKELAGTKDKHHTRIVLYKHIVRKLK
jgi:hypothetical protein